MLQAVMIYIIAIDIHSLYDEISTPRLADKISG
jgi:hypothetical protein